MYTPYTGHADTPEIKHSGGRTFVWKVAPGGAKIIESADDCDVARKGTLCIVALWG